MAKHTVEAPAVRERRPQGSRREDDRDPPRQALPGYVNKRNEDRGVPRDRRDRSKANQIYRRCAPQARADLRGERPDPPQRSTRDDGAATGSRPARWSTRSRRTSATRDLGGRLQACGMCARGWVVLAYDPTDGRLHNFIGDAQNQGGVWARSRSFPATTYEHSYFDRLRQRPEVLPRGLMRNINWAR